MSGSNSTGQSHHTSASKHTGMQTRKGSSDFWDMHPGVLSLGTCLSDDRAVEGVDLPRRPKKPLAHLELPHGVTQVRERDRLRLADDLVHIKVSRGAVRRCDAWPCAASVQSGRCSEEGGDTASELQKCIGRARLAMLSRPNFGLVDIGAYAARWLTRATGQPRHPTPAVDSHLSTSLHNPGRTSGRSPTTRITILSRYTPSSRFQVPKGEVDKRCRGDFFVFVHPPPRTTR